MSDEKIVPIDDVMPRPRWADRMPAAKGLPDPALMRFGKTFDNLSIDYAALFKALPDVMYATEEVDA